MGLWHLDYLTSEFYDSQSRELAQLYGTGLSPVVELVQKFCPPGGRVLDLGAGTGRDVARLKELGFQALGVEPSEGLRRAGKELFGLTDQDLRPGSLPGNWLDNLGDRRGETFEALLLSAVTQHLTDDELLTTLLELKDVLAPGGYLFVSHPESYAGVTGNRAPDGRLFYLRHPEVYRYFCSRVGLEEVVCQKQGDGLGRPGIVWYHQVFRSSTGTGRRPLEVIDSILRKDSKTTTYKFALLRALAELAETGYRQVLWDASGRAGVPLTSIAHKWLEFYWTVVAADPLVYQGPKQKDRADIVFRPALFRLVERFPEGSQAFLAGVKKGDSRLTDDPDYEDCLGKIIEAIKKGPVVYAGEGIFSHSTDRVWLPGALWQEFCSLSPWIRNAVVAQWAAYTAQLPGNTITHGQALDLLDPFVVSERSTALSRQLFEPLLAGGQTCIWTGRPVKKLAIDHVLPFSVWRNNDLWNLLPTEFTVNAAKSDKLPSRNLLMASKPRILECWEILSQSQVTGRLFLAEADEFVGRPLAGFHAQARETLFASLREAVEITAVNRGCDRWEPD